MMTTLTTDAWTVATRNVRIWNEATTPADLAKAALPDDHEEVEVGGADDVLFAHRVHLLWFTLRILQRLALQYGHLHG